MAAACQRAEAQRQPDGRLRVPRRLSASAPMPARRSTMVGERAGDSSDSGFELPAHTTVDLLAHHPLASNATLGVNVNNLFDRRYYERSYNNVWVAPASRAT
ncbi:hypothetical protein ACPA9J_04360 [Pseudomonas aeruginosa]